LDPQRRKLNQIIARGRTTPGKTQPNDTGYWKQLAWLKEQKYQALIEQSSGETKEVTEPKK